MGFGFLYNDIYQQYIDSLINVATTNDPDICCPEPPATVIRQQVLCLDHTHQELTFIDIGLLQIITEIMLSLESHKQ